MQTPPLERARPASALAWFALGSAIASLGAMIWFAQSVSALLSWFTLWILSPPIVAVALARLMRVRARSWPILLIAGLALVFGPAVYIAVGLGPSDAQNALVFAVAPFWQLLGLGVAWLVAIFMDAIAARRASA